MQFSNDRHVISYRRRAPAFRGMAGWWLVRSVTPPTPNAERPHTVFGDGSRRARVVFIGRIHQKSRADEIRACRPWLAAELAAIQPELVVCFGALRGCFARAAASIDLDPGGEASLERWE